MLYVSYCVHARNHEYVQDIDNSLSPHIYRLVDVKPPSSPVSYKKPPPSERPLLRAQTVGAGLGFNRQSKKAMLLRWCQREIKDYDVRNHAHVIHLQ